MRFSNYIVSVSVLLLAATEPVFADKQEDGHPYFTNKFSLDLGMFYPERQISVRVDALIGGQNRSIDFEDGFGLKESDETFSLNFGWHFGKKWQLATQYFASDGAQSKVLEEDVEFGEVVFEAGTGVRAGTDFTMLRFFFAREFETADDHEVGVGAGFHWLEIGAFIEGELIVNGDNSRFHRESARAAAPLPNLGAWYAYSISPKWLFRARLDWISANIDPYDGTLINAALGLNYQMLENVGLGLSYNYFKLDVGISEDKWRGRATTKYQGVFAYLSFYW